jgi:glycine/serine hydroxymethyltransferase
VVTGPPIFGFSNYNDFHERYFGGKEVDPLEKLTRQKTIKIARARYAKRMPNNGVISEPNQPL